jgi:hypothetical protein
MGEAHPMRQTLYLQQPGDGLKIEPSDIHQGQFGDCFFLSSLGEIALKDPSFIADNMIFRNGNGSETIHLYNNAFGEPIDSPYGLQTNFEATSIRVRNKFPADAVNNFNTTDIVGGLKEIWPQVIEKAYARDLHGYSFLANGGYDQAAMETLTGNQAFYEPSYLVSLSQLEGFQSSPTAMVTFDTPSQGSLGYSLITDHAYMFDGIVESNGVSYVHLLNPWGTNQPGLIPVSAIAQNFSGITHGTV